MEVCITNFGGRVVSLVVPDANGKPTDVVLGYDNLKQYTDSVNSPSDFGSSVGRYANRIGGGKLTVAGKTYQLPQNNFGHCLHGGPSGWIYQVYDAKQPNDSTLILTIVSPDGDNNFPGTVTAHTTYKVLSNNTLDITFDATTDKETVVNMTNHSYFNLNGDPSKEGTNMWLYLNADNYTRRLYIHDNGRDSSRRGHTDGLPQGTRSLSDHQRHLVRADSQRFGLRPQLVSQHIQGRQGRRHEGLRCALVTDYKDWSLDVYQRAGRAGLHRQLPGNRRKLQARHQVSEARIGLSGEPEISRLTQQA